MTMIKCISPIDGSAYAERPVLAPDAAKAAVARARAAQVAWADLPLSDRRDKVLSGIAALNAMKDRVVADLAWSMGRPTKWGGEFSGVNERANYMASIAESALAPLVTSK